MTKNLPLILVFLVKTIVNLIILIYFIILISVYNKNYQNLRSPIGLYSTIMLLSSRRQHSYLLTLLSSCQTWRTSTWQPGPLDDLWSRCDNPHYNTSPAQFSSPSSGICDEDMLLIVTLIWNMLMMEEMVVFTIFNTWPSLPDLVQPGRLVDPEHVQASPHLQVKPPPQPLRLCQGGHSWNLPKPS